jgi:hypothetical protein
MKPEQKSDVDAVHRFAVVPEIMEKEEWLKHRDSRSRRRCRRLMTIRPEAELRPSASRYA